MILLLRAFGAPVSPLRGLGLTATLVALTAIAGCGGSPNTPNGPVVGTGGGPVPPPANYVTAAVTVTIAGTPGNGDAMRPAYLSRNTQSVVISLSAVSGNPAGGPASVIDTTPKSPNCKSAGAVLTCTGTVKALAGHDTFSVTAFSSPGGNGLLLSSGTATAQIGSGGGVRLGTSDTGIGGVIAKLKLTLSQTSVARGKAAIVPFTLTAFDASGAQIGGNSSYQAPIVVTIQGDTTGAFGLQNGGAKGSSISVVRPSNSLAVLYNGSVQAPSITVQAAVSGPNSASAQAALAVSGTPPPPPPGTIYVLNTGTNLGLGANVTVYDGNASGNTAPKRTLKLDPKRYARSLAVDSTGRLYVGYFDTTTGVQAASGTPDTGNVVEVYAAGASGSASPVATISADPKTSSTLYPIQMTFDSSGDLVTYGATTVDGNTGNSVSIYAAGADGATAPLHAWNFATPYLRYSGPIGLGLDASNNFYLSGTLTTSLGPTYGVFANTAANSSDPSSPVSRMIPADSTTGLTGSFIANLGLDSAGEIFVGNLTLQGSTSLSCQAQTSVFAAGATGGTTDNTPLRVVIFQGGTTTNKNCYLPNPLSGFFPAIAVYGASLFFADEFNNAVSVFATTSNGTTKPQRTIAGSATGISTPIGIAISALASGALK